jgi:exopolyphosphatase/pppGpp-phosphohydrolase
MEKDRAGVIVGGLVVLDELLACVGASECLTSESDILDGLAQSLLGAP